MEKTSRGPSWHHRRALGMIVRRFPQVHLVIGLLGNGVFMVGSVLFLTGVQHVGTWFFLLGSCGMFLGSLGEVVRVRSKHHLTEVDADPVDPDERWSETRRKPSLTD